LQTARQTTVEMQRLVRVTRKARMGVLQLP
jgi:hypothetical protein